MAGEWMNSSIYEEQVGTRSWIHQQRTSQKVNLCSGTAAAAAAVGGDGGDDDDCQDCSRMKIESEFGYVGAPLRPSVSRTCTQ